MSFGITKTIPAGRGSEAVAALYDGTLHEFEFHMAGRPSRLNVGDFVYTIFNHHLVGRLKIKELIGGAINPSSGKPRTLIMVACPANSCPFPFRDRDIAAPAIMMALIGGSGYILTDGTPLCIVIEDVQLQCDFVESIGLGKRQGLSYKSR